MILTTDKAVAPVVVYDHPWNRYVRLVQSDRYVEIEREELGELIETLQMVQRKQQEREERGKKAVDEYQASVP